MTKTHKGALLCYLLISALSFIYLVLPQNAGVSVPIFVLVQFGCLCFLMPRKKPLLLFIPIFVLSLHPFISGSRMWRVPNFFVIMLLYSIMSLCMTGSFPIKEVSPRFLGDTLENALRPVIHAAVPLKWGAELNQSHTKLVKRIAAGVAVSVPVLGLLVVLLASADQIFSHGTAAFLARALDIIRPDALAKAVLGLAAGFYLFGVVYSVYRPKETQPLAAKASGGDLLVLNILLSSMLALYTVFVAIQFKYLFAGGSSLPYGLTYTDYARRGFFELLFLTGLNILLILVASGLTKGQSGGGAKLTIVLCCYLCVVTMVLLVSSFYRMWLYCNSDGLTRLRFLVLGFLIFEAVGLAATFFYILKPRFNIVGVYACLALVYYLTLNVVPMDAVIAKDQVDRYFTANGTGTAYAVTLSADAAPQIARLLNADDPVVAEMARGYFTNIREAHAARTHWQSRNLSFERALQYGD